MVIESLAKGEIRSVIRFLTARSTSTADIQCQMTEVYGTEAIRDREAETKIRENRRFTLITLSLEFSDAFRMGVFKIVTEDLNFNKLCSRWVPRLPSQRNTKKRGLLVHWTF
ncbi:HTH_48 domain-containing protein [Trichonephila clavipes]|nr:HTH_48 domain-containing protein [Trichonephila clavipes]